MGASNRATTGLGRTATAANTTGRVAVDRFNTTPTPPASGPAVASLAIAAARVSADRTRQRAAGGSVAPAVTNRPAVLASVVGDLGGLHTLGGRY